MPLEILENNKRVIFLFFERKSAREDFPSQWEIYLTSNYWKSWQEKIKNFQNLDEMNFYADRLSALRDFICQSFADKERINNILEIKKEEDRLQNISEEEWKKEDKFADVKFKELSNKEILNDPWFSERIDEIFGTSLKVKTKKQDSRNYNYNLEYDNFTREELIKEIEWLEAELMKIKGKENSKTSQTKYHNLERQLNKVNLSLSKLKNHQSILPNNFSKSLVFGVLGLVIIVIGLIVYKFKKTKIKK